VIVPLIEWAWPYIETIISGVLDMLLSNVKLFTALLAGDWEAAGEALTEIAKGAMQALVGVISMGWDAIATGIEFVGQGILGFVYGLWKNIVQWTEDSLNKMIDLINGFIESANRVTEKVGISLPKLGRIHLQADKIEIPKLKIQRWSETSFSKEIDEFLKKDEEEEEEEEEDIDKEFEDEPEREPAPALPKSQLPVAPKPEIPATPPAATIPPVENPEISVDIPETPESEPPTIPAPSVSVPALDTPVPVSVTNWDQMVARTDVQVPEEPPEVRAGGRGDPRRHTGARARSRWSNRRQSSLPLLNSRISPTYRRVRSRPFPRPLSRSRRLSPQRSRISRSPASLNPRLHRPRRSPSRSRLR
jgi:hypothetical protein